MAARSHGEGGGGSSRWSGRDNAKLLPDVKHRAKAKVRTSHLLPGHGYQEWRKQERSQGWAKSFKNTASG